MALPYRKKLKIPLTINSEYTEYTICSRCRSIYRIDVGHGYGITHELHEQGSCLLTHPNWLVGRYRSYEEAMIALRVKLGRWEKRAGMDLRERQPASPFHYRRDRRIGSSLQYLGPERRRPGRMAPRSNGS